MPVREDVGRTTEAMRHWRKEIVQKDTKLTRAVDSAYDANAILDQFTTIEICITQDLSAQACV
jgi:hypothetical protein